MLKKRLVSERCVNLKKSNPYPKDSFGLLGREAPIGEPLGLNSDNLFSSINQPDVRLEFGLQKLSLLIPLGLLDTD